MLKNLMNRYYYGKAGKADLTPDDLPTTRWQLFWETLRTHLAELVKLNLLQLVFWVPTIVVLLLGYSAMMNQMQLMDLGGGTSIQTKIVDEQALAAAADETGATQVTLEKEPVVSVADTVQQLNGLVLMTLLLLVPCIAITGPGTAGVSYVVRNWARDEHAFLWSDFKDAMKENWKQSLLVSTLTGLAPLLVYLSWVYYGSLAQQQPLMVVPQALVAIIGLVWALCVTYAHPLIVSYELKAKGVLRNAVLLGIARLPMSVGIRLLHCVPVLIGAAIFFLINPFFAVMFLFVWYVLIGFALSRFITASYTNAVFDRFINSRIEGAKVNRGLRAPDDDDEDEAQTAGTPEEGDR